MSSTTRRAVVTGVGVLNPLGLDAASFWEGLRAGKSGVHTISLFDPSSLTTRFAGELVNFDAKRYIDKKDRRQLKMMTRSIEVAVSAAQLALNDGRVEKDKLDRTRFGVEFGAGLIASELDELAEAAKISSNCQPGIVDLEKWGELGLGNIQPLWMLKYLPNMLACQVSILHDAQGPNNSITEGDVGSLLALGEACRIIRRDQADFFLVGGAESKVNPLSMVRQCLFGRLSRRNDDPAGACRPFEKSRDGGVIGEGACVLVVEDLEHAQRRGARIYAEVVGFGAAFDRDRSGKGLVRAMQAALRQAGLSPADMDHVNAHGLGGPEADTCEARALLEVFGPDMPVLAAKSYFGNLGAGSGLSELAASVLALHHGSVPATLNYQQPDPNCPVNVQRAPRPARKPHFLKLGFAEMGQCAAAVVRRWGD
jgi:3-oxoacyl-[acyl-carrier-protein] synthase II